MLITKNLLVFGLTHALIDATCAATLFGGLLVSKAELLTAGYLIILYNLLAFGLQAPLGALVDHFRIPTTSAIAGCLITAIGAMFYQMPLTAVILVGVGNALFHLGGGIFSLNLTEGKATAPGIFVAPGALGLALGILIGRGGYFMPWPFVALLVLAIAFIYLIKKPQVNYNTCSKVKFNSFEIITMLLLLSIAIRSIVGLAVEYPWKADINLLIMLTMAVVLGKALGGFLADRFGWIAVAIAGLLVSAPLIAIGGDFEFTGILGMFLFNLTMPVTLVALANMLPGRAGFAFGLTTLALVTGALLTFTEFKPVLANNWVVFATILISAGVLYQGLRLYFRDIDNSPGVIEFEEIEVEELAGAGKI